MSNENATHEDRLAELKEKQAKVKEMGGKDRVAAQGKKGKMTARARIDALLDKGSFHETGMFGRQRNEGAYENTPGDAVVTGYGKIGGKKVYIYSQDFTSMGGTMAETQALKICNIMDVAIKTGYPIIALNDSGGARIQDGIDSLAGYGQIFRRNVAASGVIPQICAILGPTAGGGVYSPALMDFIFMVKGISYAFITGPKVVKTVTGQDISDEDLGGAVVAQKKSGVVCRSENSEVECFENIRELMSYLPASNRKKPPRKNWGDKADRIDTELFELIPTNPSKPYDMHLVIERIFDQRDDGKKNYFELFPLWATNIITCFSRLNGHTVGIIANQPFSKAGSLDIDACDKGSRFIRFCNAFNIPVISMVDVPGYMPGSGQEWGGIIRHGAKMLYAYAEATVPKLTVTIRKAYGGAYLGMCSKSLGADFVFSWPTTEIAVMGAESAAPIVFRKELENSDNPEELLKEKIKVYRDEFSNPYHGAEHLYIDEIIDPAETRAKLAATLELLINKVESQPDRKHGITPV